MFPLNWSGSGIKRWLGSRHMSAHKPLQDAKKYKLHVLAYCSFRLLHQHRQRKSWSQVGQPDGLDREKHWFQQVEEELHCSNTSPRQVCEHFGHRLIGFRAHAIGRAAARTFWQILMVPTITGILPSTWTFSRLEENGSAVFRQKINFVNLQIFLSSTRVISHCH